MKLFTFYLHDGVSTMPKFLVEALPSNQDAVDFGRQLLHERPRYTTVEVIQGDLEVATLRDEQY